MVILAMKAKGIQMRAVKGLWATGSHYRFQCSSLKCVCVCVCVCVCGLWRNPRGNVKEAPGQGLEGSGSRDTH